MLRMYKATAEQLLAVVVYLNDQVGVTPDQIFERTRHVQMGDPYQQNILNNARKTLRGGLTEAQMRAFPYHLITLLTKGLMEEDKPHGDKELLDTLVRVLQQPYTRNILSGGALAKLRDNLLLPSEVGGLTHRLNAKEMACGSCGMPFHDHESVTYVRDAAGGGQFLACHRCTVPQVVPCATCESTAALSTKAQSAMSRMQCPECSAKKAVIAPKGAKMASSDAFHPLTTTSPRGDRSTPFDLSTVEDTGGNPTPAAETAGAPNLAAAFADQHFLVGSPTAWPASISLDNRRSMALDSLRTRISRNEWPAHAEHHLGSGIVVNADGILRSLSLLEVALFPPAAPTRTPPRRI